MNNDFNNPHELHNRIRSLRIENGYTQQFVADYIGVDVSTYAHYERHHRTPNAEKLKKLAELYNIHDAMLDSKFPIITVEQYPKELLDSLDDALNTCTVDNNMTYQELLSMSENIRCAFKPVMKIWEENLSVPEMTMDMINSLDRGTTIIHTYLDRRAKALIEKYTQIQDEIYKALRHV